MTSRPVVRKAVLPVAGLGTRFLPYSKACPKEMLPIVDKPLVQYAVEEAVAAGITQIIFVTNRAKRAIEDHFDPSSEAGLVSRLLGRAELFNELRRQLPAGVQYAYVRQPEALGLGHAVLCARFLVGDEPFAVLLPDDLMDASTPVLSQMMSQFSLTGASVVAVESVNRDETDKYGIVRTDETGGALARMRAIVEKPKPAEALSTLAAVGRYIFTPSIFDDLARLTPGAKGELQLTDAISMLMAREAVFAYRFAGSRYDCGSKLGFLVATVRFALAHPELALPFSRFLDELALDRKLVDAGAWERQTQSATGSRPVAENVRSELLLKSGHASDGVHSTSQ